MKYYILTAAMYTGLACWFCTLLLIGFVILKLRKKKKNEKKEYSFFESKLINEDGVF
jgi:hypothetical protein